MHMEKNDELDTEKQAQFRSIGTNSQRRTKPITTRSVDYF